MTRAGNPGQASCWPTALLTSVRHLPEHANLCVALSGGMDSVLLLHAAAFLYAESGRLSAIHINHQLQPNATETEEFCQQLCESLGVPCHIVRVDVSARARQVGAGSGGLEEEARGARYDAFQEHLGAGELLLMAHHGDDQAETVLFRLIRGSGVTGLAGMPVTRALGKGSLHRPLLAFSRDDLAHWASGHDLSWVDDPSNQDQRFDRNFLRHSVIPALKSRWPSLVRRVLGTAEACRESHELAASLAVVHLERCVSESGGVDLSALSALSVAEQKNLIRWWVTSQNRPPPSPANWQRLLSEFIEAKSDGQPEFLGDGYSLRRYQNTLYLVPEPAKLPVEQHQLVPGREALWGAWSVTLVRAGTRAEGESCVPPDLWIVQRKGGERVRLSGSAPSKSLKNWLQERKVPTWERDQLPLLFEGAGADGQLVAVGNLWVSGKYDGRSPASGWRLILERDSN